MRWYWWLFIGLVVGVVAIVALPVIFKKSGNPDSLEKARQAKAEKAKQKETETQQDEGGTAPDL